MSHHEGCLRVPPLESGHEVVHHEECVVIRLDEEVQPRPVLLPHLHQTKLHLEVNIGKCVGIFSLVIMYIQKILGFGCL